MIKAIIRSLILGILVLFSRCSNTNSQQSSDKIQDIGKQTVKVVIENVGAKKFKELITSGQGIILDVRTPKEVAQGYIKDASVINYYDKEFKNKINLIKKDNPVYVYCKSGRRSALAAKILQQNGFNKVYNLSGGLMAWSNAGYKLVIPEGAKDDNIQEYSLESFKKLLDTDLPVLVDFHTLWCVPCRKMAPIVDEIAKQYKNKARIVRIDIDKSKDLAKNYNIKGIPVFILFKNGEVKWRHSGVTTSEKLSEIIEVN